MTDTNAGIDVLHAAWKAAIRSGDADRAVELLTPDYSLFVAGSGPIIGRAEVRDLLATALTSYAIEPRFESEERIVSGDLAFERGWDIQTVEPRDGGPRQTHRRRAFLIILRDRDGAWRYARGISFPE